MLQRADVFFGLFACRDAIARERAGTPLRLEAENLESLGDFLELGAVTLKNHAKLPEVL